jgi:ABC-type phosphate transport system substrate-binding protein
MGAFLRIGGFVLVGLVAASVDAESPRPYVVIVHPKSQVTKVDRKYLAEVFFRRTTRWPDDTPIRPVDLVPDSSARIRFSQEVLSRSVASVRSYWQQRIFSGEGLPPPELSDDQAVVEYVVSHPGAIGYVASGIRTDGARAVDLN